MKRLDVLDGMRGYFLVFMLLNHLSFTGGYLLVKVNHGELGFVQDAQGFVFLSGLLIGLVYSGQMMKKGYEGAALKMRKRAFELYRWALFCVLFVIAAGLLLPGVHEHWRPWLWSISEQPIMFFLASATLLYQPTYMDILPQYIVYLFVAPPLLWLCVTGRWRTVAILSALSWIFVQFGLHLPLADAIHAGMKGIDGELALRAHFNVFAWQVLFMGGMVLGALTATRQVEWDKVLRPERPELALAAVALLVFFLFWRQGFVWGLIPDQLAERFRTHDTRGEFSLVYLVNFAAISYLVAWLLIAGQRSASAVARGASAVLHTVFTLPFLRLIGRHSLHVYVWHVIAVYVLRVVDKEIGPFNEATKTAIAILAVASLAIPALWRDWRASLRAEASTAKAARAKAA